jgi:predicted O-linked N-acetylglucosamine transferase (SPINDLY family)
MTINLFSQKPAGPDPRRVQEVVSLFQGGDFLQAQTQAEALTRQFPKHAFGWTMLGAVHRAQGRHADAVPALQTVANLQPKDAKAHFNLANALRDLDRFKPAADSYQTALKLQPELPNGFFHLGCMQQALGLLPQAERSYRKALAGTPAQAQVLGNLAHVLQDLGRLDDALDGYDRAIAVDPTQPALHFNRGDVLHDLGRLDAAEAACRQALALDPGMAQAHSQHGVVLQDMGRLDEAIASHRRAVALAPDDPDTRSRLLFCLHYAAQPGNADAVLEEAREYGRLVARLAEGDRFAWNGDRAPGRLRVGLVSADLREHPVGHFLESILASIDRQRLELVGLPTQTFEDALTRRIRPYFSDWSPITGCSDAEAAERVRALGLQVVLDLSGHTAGSRLPLFARRLAPVQAAWLGYFGTTGVETIDYLVADPLTLPPALEPGFTETVRRLPDTRLCFTPPREAPAPNPLPAATAGALTFGSFSNLNKVNDGVVALWSRILRDLPGSRLLVKAKQLRDHGAHHALQARFAAHGVDAARLVLEGPAPRAEYLAAYHRVDMVLDPFPYPGGTTTAESLWMGVPVLTLAGDSFLGRQGLGLLVNAGLPEWVASDADDYHARALRWATDLPRLADLRARLRESLRTSPLFDAPRFARRFEAALWGMWDERKSSLPEC